MPLEGPITRAASTVLSALRETFGMLVDPGQRIWWGFLLSAAVVAALVVWIDPRPQGHRRTPGSPLSRSAWLDVQLLFVGGIVRALGATVWAVSAFGTALWLVERLDAWFPGDRIHALSPLAVAVVYTGVLFVAWDLSRYALHRLLHGVPALWELHKVHHSAEVLTPITLYRTHPIESLLYAGRGVIVTGVVTGVFFHLFGRSAVELELLGVNVLGFVFNLVGANLRHSHVWWSWGAWERWFISPAQHQLHHAADARASQNLGTWLSIWDRWGGTLAMADGEPPRAFGLPASERNHHPHRLGSAIVGPIAAALATLAPRTRRRVVPAALLAGSLVPSQAGAAPAQGAPTSDPRAYAGPTTPGDAPEAAPARVHAPSSEDDDEGPAEGSPPVAASEPEPEPTAPSIPETPAPLETSDSDDTTTRTVIVGSMFDSAELPRVAGSAHVVTREELERHEYDDVHRILQSVPGVYVRGEDGFGLRPNIGLRGANPDRSAKVTLMEDGILLGPAPYSAPAAYYFPLSTRMVGMEVFKGPSAIRYGPNTIGGAINLRTREIPEDHESVVDVAGGRFGYAKGHGYWGMRKKGFGVLLEAVHLRSTGFKELDGGGDTGFAKNEAMVKAGYRTPEGARITHQVEVKAGFANERSNETYLGLTQADFEATPYRRYAASARDQMNWWRSQAEVSYLVREDETLEVETRLYRHDFHRRWVRFDRLRGGPDPNSILGDPDSGQLAVKAAILRGDEDSVSPDDAILLTTNDRRFVSEGAQSALRWRPHWRIVEQDLELGVRVHHDAIIRDQPLNAFLMQSGVLVPEGTPPTYGSKNRGETVAAAFHLFDAVTFADRVTVAPGVRVEVISMRFANGLDGRHARRLDTAVSPGAGALVKATPWLDVFAGVHRGFSPVAPGQPESVKPELSVNYEAGLRAVHKGLWAEAVGFFSDYSNLNGSCTFSSGCEDQNVGEQFNAGRVFVYGLESLARYRHRFDSGLGLTVGAQYTYTGSQFRDTFSSSFPQWGDVVAGDHLPYVPEHIVGGSIGLGGRIWDVTATPSFTGQMRDVASRGEIPTGQRIPGFFTLDLAAEVRVLGRFRLYAIVNNATNNAYIAARRPYGIRPGAPLTFMLGVKVYVFP